MPSKLHVEFVTADGTLHSEEADFVRIPGSEGELGILPHHTPMVTPLRTGEIMVRNAEKEDYFFVGGGFMEVLPDKIVILADDAERVEDIDEARAEEARQRAQELLATNEGNAEVAAELERAVFRLKVADIRRRHREHPRPPE